MGASGGVLDTANRHRRSSAGAHSIILMYRDGEVKRASKLHDDGWQGKTQNDPVSQSNPGTSSSPGFRSQLCDMVDSHYDYTSSSAAASDSQS
ncbi:hypothetical protein B7463_g962, partial [Scytalidium lignicola]